MTKRRTWVRADGKRPIRADGRWASSTKPWTWDAFQAVKDSNAGDGFGIMLGDGLACWDLDHVSDGEAREFIASISQPIVFVERSVSGSGVHVFVLAPEGVGHKHGRIEFYSRERFIRVTGRKFKY